MGGRYGGPVPHSSYTTSWDTIMVILLPGLDIMTMIQTG